MIAMIAFRVLQVLNDCNDCLSSVASHNDSTDCFHKYFKLKTLQQLVVKCTFVLRTSTPYLSFFVSNEVSMIIFLISGQAPFDDFLLFLNDFGIDVEG